MKNYTKITSILLVLALWVSAQMAMAQGPWQSSGRIAVSSDGNQHDSDDWAATAVTLAIIGNRQLQNKLVHYDYANHVWDNNPLFENNITESALGTAQRFGFDQSKFFNGFRNKNAAIQSIKNAVNASSANNRLFFILAGPMEIPYQGILAAQPSKRQYVTCISHSTWNDFHGACDDGRDWTECHPGSHHKDDIVNLGVQWIAISDQNTNKFNTGSMGAWSFLNRLGGQYDAAYKYTYQRVDVAYTTGDASDAGMAYYLFTGDQNGNTTKLENFMRSPVNGGGNGGQAIGNGTFFLTAPGGSQRLLSRPVENYSARMHNPGNWNDQKWIFNHLGNDVYTIRNKGNNRYLEVPNGVCGNNADVSTWTGAGSDHQKWVATSLGNNTYAFKPLHCQSRALDRSNGATNANVQIYDFSAGNNNQKWQLTPEGSARLAPQTAEKYLPYPNPVTDAFFVPGLSIGDQVTIYNTEGKVVFEVQAQANTEKILMNDLPSGLYFLHVSDKVGHTIVKQ